MSDISEDEAEPGILVTAKNAALEPFYYVVSKPAQRAYLSTILILLTSITLVATAVIAYLFFYYSYVPKHGFSRPIYLQFDPDRYPHGTTSLSQELVSNLRYDVKVILHMPRTPSNTAAGNFMLDLQLLGPITPSVIPSIKAEVLARERRPAILTYQSPTMEHVHRAAALPLYITGLRQESETLNVKMMESIEFERGWRNVPTTARLELRSAEKLQIYDAQVVFTARLHGLRYLMYNYRVTSFLVLTSAFWTVEMAFAGLVWLALSIFIFPSNGTTAIKKEEEEAKTIKEERQGDHSEDMSDTPHTFPTLSGQPPLRYSSPRVKKEEDEPQLVFADTQLATGEADDEDDDFVLDESGPIGRAVSDSGIGTSLESSGGRPESVRRRSRLSSGGQ